ncbi:MAG: polysulfide reductase NrfD [Candidatus Zixiibacteriota bacterium]|nr:MAG: polysulfide reductase NrfD [candidate division Zixibacteria bacterium]
MATIDRRANWVSEKLLLGMSWPDYLRGLITPFNAVVAAILAVGIPLTYIRFTQGIGAISNLTDTNPWGLWIGVDVLSGVALAAGGFTTGTAVYLFGMKKYRPVVRPAVLTGFLGYAFVVVGLCYDLGRPWRLPFPMVVSYGVTSVMFLVGWHVATYLTVQFLEFCPALFEWLGWKNFRKWAVRITIGATILGVILSTLHQSALGALFLLAGAKLHPLWYSPFIPVFFFVSAIIAGMTMVIFESMLSHRIFGDQVTHQDHKNLDDITLGLGKGATALLFTYFCLKWVGVAHDHNWDYLATPLGSWFLLEVLGFVLAPCLLLFWATRRHSPGWVRVGAVWSILGVIFNRVNVSIIALNWQQPDRYVPHWMEFGVTITVITIGVLTFRFIVNRMPILRKHPAYADDPDH